MASHDAEVIKHVYSPTARRACTHSPGARQLSMVDRGTIVRSGVRGVAVVVRGVLCCCRQRRTSLGAHARRWDVGYCTGWTSICSVCSCVEWQLYEEHAWPWGVQGTPSRRHRWRPAQAWVHRSTQGFVELSTCAGTRFGSRWQAAPLLSDEVGAVPSKEWHEQLCLRGFRG